jgi:hypothetical protein
MRIAGKVDTSCEHPLKDCAAIEGEIVGSATWGGTIALHDGDVISVGTSNSPYVFKFRIG